MSNVSVDPEILKFPTLLIGGTLKSEIDRGAKVRGTIFLGLLSLVPD